MSNISDGSCPQEKEGFTCQKRVFGYITLASATIHGSLECLSADLHSIFFPSQVLLSQITIIAQQNECFPGKMSVFRSILESVCLSVCPSLCQSVYKILVVLCLQLTLLQFCFNCKEKLCTYIDHILKHFKRQF